MSGFTTLRMALVNTAMKVITNPPVMTDPLVAPAPLQTAAQILTADAALVRGEKARDQFRANQIAKMDLPMANPSGLRELFSPSVKPRPTFFDFETDVGQESRFDRDRRLFGNEDHYSFRPLPIPTAFQTTGMRDDYDDYHKPTDGVPIATDARIDQMSDEEALAILADFISLVLLDEAIRILANAEGSYSLKHVLPFLPR